MKKYCCAKCKLDLLPNEVHIVVENKKAEEKCPNCGSSVRITKK
jgi:DNA-directed RNA polymerase subunit RPC12/RpoP